MEKESDRFENEERDTSIITSFDSYEDALLKDNIDKMQSLLDNDMTLCAVLTYKGDSLLHYCAKYNSKRIMKAFLETGVNPSIENKSEIQPIHLAALKGNISIINMLLAYGATVNVKDDKGRCPLHYSVQTGHLSCIALFMKHGASLVERDYKGKTPLILAAKYDQSIVFEWLLKHGARILDQDSEGNTVLHAAVQSGNESIIKTILDNIYGKQLTHTVNFNMKTPLDIAKQKSSRYSTDLGKYRSIHRYIYNYTYHPATSTIIRYIATHTAMILLPIMIIYTIFIFINVFYPFLYVNMPQFIPFSCVFGILTIFLWIYLVFSNPGIIVDKHNNPITSVDNSHVYRSIYTDIMNGQGSSSKLLCASCEIERPDRSKHCIVCDTCVLKMDHHCPWINNCVGLKNHRTFVVFLTVAAITLCDICYIIFEYGQNTILLNQLVSDHLGMALLLGFYALNISWILAYCIYLLSIQLIQISHNITTNESINWRHYNYLLINGRAFHNPYDKGFIKNWLLFWGCSKENYELISSSDNTV